MFIRIDQRIFRELTSEEKFGNKFKLRFIIDKVAINRTLCIMTNVGSGQNPDLFKWLDITSERLRMSSVNKNHKLKNSKTFHLWPEWWHFWKKSITHLLGYRWFPLPRILWEERWWQCSSPLLFKTQKHKNPFTSQSLQEAEALSCSTNDCTFSEGYFRNKLIEA